MRLTTFTDYSLRVLIFLATDPDRRATIREIAQAFDISENHLMKVAHLLGKAGVLANVRGRGGGLELARAPGAISIGRVVRATEGPAMPAACFSGEEDACVLMPICRLRDVLREAVRTFYGVLDGYTLEDLVHNRPALSQTLFAEPPRSRAKRRRAPILIRRAKS